MKIAYICALLLLSLSYVKSEDTSDTINLDENAADSEEFYQDFQ